MHFLVCNPLCVVRIPNPRYRIVFECQFQLHVDCVQICILILDFNYMKLKGDAIMYPIMKTSLLVPGTRFLSVWIENFIKSSTTVITQEKRYLETEYTFEEYNRCWNGRHWLETCQPSNQKLLLLLAVRFEIGFINNQAILLIIVLLIT